MWFTVSRLREAAEKDEGEYRFETRRIPPSLTNVGRLSLVSARRKSGNKQAGHKERSKCCWNRSGSNVSI